MTRPVETGILFWTTFALVAFNGFLHDTINWFLN